MKEKKKQFKFQVYSWPREVPASAASLGCLVRDQWDDFGFKTLYNLIVFDEAGKKHEIGYVKIGRFGMGTKVFRTKIPAAFTKLKDHFFSLGQDDSYYVALAKLSENIKKEVLQGLRDLVADPDCWEKAKGEKVTHTSLLRGVTQRSVEKQYRRLLRGGARLTDYDFTYTAPKRMTRGDHRFQLSFTVEPESSPPTNIHVLIGRNGVGKTYILQLMTKALIAKEPVANQSGAFSCPTKDEDKDASPFANIVSVSFSAFDDFELVPEREDENNGIGYSYIGLRRVTNKGGSLGSPKSLGILSRDFAESVKLCGRGMRAKRWERALKTLESDPIFRAAEVTALTASNDSPQKLVDNAKTLFGNLSSGHRIVLLTITRLVQTVEEQTLVLVDELECHLHPPLLSAFVRALSDLLVHRNGVAIVATHSPVVLQEVPKDCVWTLSRSGRNMKAERPELETFGENVGVLTREIFGYEVTESGFHKMLHEAAQEEANFDCAVNRFNGELGAEAQAILRGLFAANDN